MKKLLLYFFLHSFQALCQEEDPSVYHAKRYLDLNIKSQQKLNFKLAKQQERLLVKLKRKEGKIARKLQRRDSLAYANFKRNPKNFDSISRVKKPDSLAFIRKSRYNFNKKLDSLQKIRDFAEDKAHVTGEGKNSTSLSKDKLHSVKYDAVHHNDIRRQINERTQYLKGIKTKSGKRLPGLKSIQKRSFYSNEKTRTFQQIADEPSIAEEKAFEFLQGKEDFNNYLSRSQDGSPYGEFSVAELEKMGYQTKQKVQNKLQKKLGPDLSNLQKNMSGQVKNYQDKIKDVKDVKNTAYQTKSSLYNIKKATKPDFKINPMRGLPFLQRIEHQYNWQTTRATPAGQPAVFSFSYMFGFKHSSSLSYGLGLATSLGLGNNWNSLKLTYEGIGLRSYGTWQWQYGIGAYIGYERMYKQALFLTNGEKISELKETPHNKTNYSEAILIGITKSYSLNDKMNGSIQILYDIWWKEKGLKSPVLLRFATIKK